MKGGTQAALALGVGYLLGRRRKMRLTTMLAVGAATGGVGGLGGTALRRGMKMLGSTEAVGKFAPQLGELADTVRSDLMDAGKAAATAAVTSRIESLTDSLQERADEPACLVFEPVHWRAELTFSLFLRHRAHLPARATGDWRRVVLRRTGAASGSSASGS